MPALPPGWEPDGHRTIAVDFDGVIHSYTSPWEHPAIIPDPPIRGMLAWLHEMMGEFRVVIFSTRCQIEEGCVAVRDYLRRDHDTCYDALLRVALHEPQAGLGELADSAGLVCTDRKPAALIYFDDRAVRFTGIERPTAAEIHDMLPWNKRSMGDSHRKQ